MASKQITITDTFQASICSVCGCGDVNQYFGINDNFIEYCGVYFSFREILYEALDIQIDHYNGKTMEICLDCKDKVIKFYHFKRKVKEVQQSYKEKPVVLKENPKPLEKRSKVVHNIYQIIENYTEKCSVSTIRVDENSKKLIIESSSSQEPEVFTTPSLVQQQQPQQEKTSERLSKRQTFVESPAHEQQQQDEIFCEPAIVIKDEVQDVDQQAIRLTLDETEQFNNFEEIDEDDSYYNSASTSYHPPNKKQKSDEQNFQPSPIFNCNLRIPVNSEQMVYELAHRLASDESFQQKLGMEVISQRQFIDSKETGVRSVIRRMMKELISEEMCNRMNTTGRSSKLSANCDGSSVKAIKTPDSIMRFLAKYAALLTSMNEEDTYNEVKKVITRWISDERNNKFLRKNRRLKQRIERQMLTMVGGNNSQSIDQLVYVPTAVTHHLISPTLDNIPPPPHMLNENEFRHLHQRRRILEDPLSSPVEHL